ncbi:MAG TPA: molybdopterin-binding protein [Xanthobacteraceae bacterium]|jgi:molybdopterin biosynthesis enzyme
MAMEPEIPQRIARFTPLADVLARLDALIEPVAPRMCELAAAAGLTLAADVVAAAPIPAAARALRDGWAVASEATADAGAYAPAPLASAAQVEVGAPLPPGADAVAALDAVAVRDGLALALAPVAPGEGVLATGADAAAGATLLERGRRLARLHVALLAAAGITSVSVRVPRLRLLRARPANDAVIDAAIACIADGVAAMGAIAESVEPNRTANDLASALPNADYDAVVVVGGTGSGRDDRTVRMLASIGEVHAHGIALLPGETSAFASLRGRPVLVLPGRLDAALAAWHMIGQAMLAGLAASREPLRLRTAKLTHKVASMVGFSELVPVRGEHASATPIASGYVPLSGLAQANGWVLIPPESEGYPAGAEVVIRPWP